MRTPKFFDGLQLINERLHSLTALARFTWI